MPVHRTIVLAGVAAAEAGAMPGEDADIPLDDQDRPLNPDSLPRRPSQIAAEAEARAKRAKRRGSGTGGAALISNGAKIAASIAGLFKHDAAPADNKVHPAAPEHHVGDDSAHAGSHINGATHVHTGVHGTSGVEMTAATTNGTHGDANGVNGTNASSDHNHTTPQPAGSAAPASFADGAHGAATLTSPTNTGQRASVVKPKVESGDFSPSKLASLCSQLQLGLSDSFVTLFNEASSLYIKGHWARSRDILEGKFLKMFPNDKPAKVLLSIMKESNFVKPADWKGFRKLTSK
jgi:hypothetical protein